MANRLRGPNAQVPEERSVKSGTTLSSPSRNAARNRRNARRTRDYNPAAIGKDVAGSTGGSVGTLEAEFLIGLALLILLMFSSGSSFSDKIMSTIKRGTLLCIVFFILALVSSAGPNAAKVTKALGALIIVAILVTSPVNTLIQDLDSLVKNDWVGTNETGGTGSGNAGNSSADSGSSNASTNPAQAFINSIEDQLKLQGQKGPTGSNPFSGSNLKNDIGNSIAGTMNGIIPGSGTIIRKMFGL